MVSEPTPILEGQSICEKCKLVIKTGETVVTHYGAVWHPFCFNKYEHYYGLNKGID